MPIRPVLPLLSLPPDLSYWITGADVRGDRNGLTFRLEIEGGAPFRDPRPVPPARDVLPEPLIRALREWLDPAGVVPPQV